ncbi:alpha/beta hydrolase [Actinomycetospora corticicola]|uniref:Xaa-Pro dipeptidyl-peptidase-like domain-containing protein n=1 Tax=Actinomycetospora corticicola TaxID=663602 RepID=A0A7Y9E2L4_9PSEU|nr:alpha/beta hydrolase [Actinomycetospora corticicola]NYD39811.1 hypothetical protein [Actinomycetospora corticicola]
MPHQDIEFDAEGTTIRGWFFPASGTTDKAPTVVMAHGFTAVKEMELDRYAEVFSAHGINVLVYDNRGFGDSDGTPRQEIDPWAQIRDYRHAITYASTLDGVDPQRIGIWGSSYSGGHVLVVGAIDRRVKAVVSQVSLISGYDNYRALVRADFIDGYQTLFDTDRANRFEGKEPATVPVVAANPMDPAALPSADSWTWFTETSKNRAPNWKNEVTVRSLEMMTEYNPIDYIARIAPTPMLLMPAQNDVVAPTIFALRAYEEAREPKKITILPGGHYDAYGPGFEASSSAALDWYLTHL